MHSSFIISSILKSLTMLSQAERDDLEVRLKNLLKSDRRYKLGELQTELALHYACAGCRRLLDSILLNNSDIDGFCQFSEREDGRLGDWCSDRKREAFCCDPASIAERCRYDQSTRCASQKARDLDH